MAGQGQIFTTSDTVTTKRSITDYILMTDPNDTPCVSYFGLNNNKKFDILNLPNNKYSWLKDTLKVRSIVLNEALDTTETGVDVASGSGLLTKVGDVWMAEETGELMLVVSIATDTLTVIRNWGAEMGGAELTATVGVTTGTNLLYQFNARMEGAESDASYWTTPTEEFNYSQIMHAEIKVSGSEQDATSRYGISNMYKYQMMKYMGGLGGTRGRKGRAGDLQIDLEKTWFHGRRHLRVAQTTAGSMGGFKQYVTTNVTALAGALLDFDTLCTSIQSAWSRGGRPNLIICNAFQKRLIDSWFQGAVRTDLKEDTGGVIIDKIRTDFGTLDVMLNRWCPSAEIDIVQTEYAGWLTFRDWQEQPLAKTGDYTRTQIIGEYGFVIQNEQCHSLITGAATS